MSDAGVKKLISHTQSEDILVDIFCESMDIYLQKLNNTFAGRYELDDYDAQVLSIVMEIDLFFS